MEKKRETKTISIRRLIILTFLAEILITTLLIGNIIFSNWISAINSITQKLAADITQEISEQINSFLNESQHINEVNERLIRYGIVDLGDQAERDKFFVGVLQSHKNQIYSVTYGMEDGEYYGARRNAEGQLELVMNNSETGGNSWYYSVNENVTKGSFVFETPLFDVRTREWYLAAKNKGEAIFSPVYKHFVMDDLSISAATPIYNNEGDLQGVFGTHMILSDINEYVRKIVSNYTGYALVMEKESNLLIANSFKGENFKINKDGTIKRNTMDEVGNPLMSGIYKESLNEKSSHFQFSMDGLVYYANVIQYQNEGLDWVIIAAIPRDIFTWKIYENIKITAVIVIITVLALCGIYLYIIKWTFRPIDNLIATSNEIAAGNILKRATVVRNDEIGKLSTAFNDMADKIYQHVNFLEEKVEERTQKLVTANEELNQTKEDLYLILDTTAEGIFGIDLEGNCIFCNDSGIKLLGYQSQQEMLGKNIHTLVSNKQEDTEQLLRGSHRILSSLMAGEKLYVSNEAFYRKDNSSVEVEYHSYPKKKEGKLIGAVITFTDITEKKKDEEKIKYLSRHDSLTGLLNRGSFEAKLREIEQNEILPVSIIFGDLNGLKLMNDIFGHVAGDKLIQKTAEVLLRVCENLEQIARVGGDEFIILLPQTDALHAAEIMAKIKEELSNETIFEVRCSIALGFDTRIDLAHSLEQIMGNAESQMYKEKLLSKKNYGKDTIQTILKTIQDRKPGEKEHAEGVAELCVELGRRMGLPETEIKRLREVGYVHDIGKIVIEEEILKKEEMSENEKQQMQQHPIVGYRILNLFDETLNLADAVYAHHEKWDGTGYPKGLRGEEIPLLSRMLAIVERYDRIFVKEGKSDPLMARQIALLGLQKEAGIAFDPSLTSLFIQMIEEKNER